MRYGATITNDIAIWPPRVAGRQTLYDADIPPGRDDLTAWATSAGTTRTLTSARP
jgi:NitT/TauT family transport system ATP-binding protein